MGAVFPFVAKEAKIEFFDSCKKAIDACREVVLGEAVWWVGATGSRKCAF